MDVGFACSVPGEAGRLLVGCFASFLAEGPLLAAGVVVCSASLTAESGELLAAGAAGVAVCAESGELQVAGGGRGAACTGRHTMSIFPAVAGGGGRGKDGLNWRGYKLYRYRRR